VWGGALGGGGGAGGGGPAAGGGGGGGGRPPFEGDTGSRRGTTPWANHQEVVVVL